MGDNIFKKTLKSLAGYFIFALGGTWVVEAVLGPSKEAFGVSDFQMLLIQGSFFRALIFAACLYFVYFMAALAVVREPGGIFVFAIGAFFLYSLVTDIRAAYANSEGLNFAVGVLGYLIFMLEDVVKIIATFHGFAEGGK